MKQAKIPKPRPAKKPIKVNLGCGANIQKGFINIDDYLLTEKNPAFLRGNAKDIPLPKDSVDYLLCDQMLEHMPMSDVVLVLYEIRRVLKKGGQAVIMVPDFRDAAQNWLNFNHDEGFNPLVYRWLSDPIYGNQNHAGEFHQTPFSAGFLHHSLNAAGLPNHEITFWPRDGAIPKWDGMNNYPKGATLRNAQLLTIIIK